MRARGQLTLALDSLVDVPGVDGPVEAREERPLLFVLPLQPARFSHSQQSMTF